MGVTKKKSVPQRIPVKIAKKKKTGGELICKNFGVTGSLGQSSHSIQEVNPPEGQTGCQRS